MENPLAEEFGQSETTVAAYSTMNTMMNWNFYINSPPKEFFDAFTKSTNFTAEKSDMREGSREVTCTLIDNNFLEWYNKGIDNHCDTFDGPFDKLVATINVCDEIFIKRVQWKLDIKGHSCPDHQIRRVFNHCVCALKQIDEVLVARTIDDSRRKYYQAILPKSPHSAIYSYYPKTAPESLPYVSITPLSKKPLTRISTSAASEPKIPHSSEFSYYPKTALGSHSSVSIFPSAKRVDTNDSVKVFSGKHGKMLAEAFKRLEDRNRPIVDDAAAASEKLFKETFDIVVDEKLLLSFNCDLCTSVGSVMGSMYLSTHRIAFLSTITLSYKEGDQNQRGYYKVVLPLNNVKAVNQSTSTSQKFIQMISIDSYEFWFEVFSDFESVVECFQEAFKSHGFQGLLVNFL